AFSAQLRVIKTSSRLVLLYYKGGYRERLSSSLIKSTVFSLLIAATIASAQTSGDSDNSGFGVVSPTAGTTISVNTGIY
ncbi:hypothetical protein WG66_004248, partial [Moniliophthora roreri]